MIAVQNILNDDQAWINTNLYVKYKLAFKKIFQTAPNFFNYGAMDFKQQKYKYKW